MLFHHCTVVSRCWLTLQVGFGAASPAALFKSCNANCSAASSHEPSQFACMAWHVRSNALTGTCTSLVQSSERRVEMLLQVYSPLDRRSSLAWGPAAATLRSWWRFQYKYSNRLPHFEHWSQRCECGISFPALASLLPWKSEWRNNDGRSKCFWGSFKLDIHPSQPGPAPKFSVISPLNSFVHCSLSLTAPQSSFSVHLFPVMRNLLLCNVIWRACLAFSWVGGGGELGFRNDVHEVHTVHHRVLFVFSFLSLLREVGALCYAVANSYLDQFYCQDRMRAARREHRIQKRSAVQYAVSERRFRDGIWAIIVIAALDGAVNHENHENEY